MSAIRVAQRTRRKADLPAGPARSQPTASTNHTTERQSPDGGDRRAAYALFAAVLVTYFATSSTHLAGGDNAEFVTIFVKGGVAHPSGYPLYCILLRLFAWMPGGPVLGSSRVTAIIGAFSVAALYRACRAWGGSSSASLVAAAAYAFSPVAWRLATEAEVFTLNALFASLLLWTAAPSLVMAPATRICVLAGLAGLALSNQLTIVLLAPVGLLAVFHALRASKSRLRTALWGVSSFGAGLLPYLYCYQVGREPNGRYVWGLPGTWRGLVHLATRADFGTFSLTSSEQSPDWVSNVSAFFVQSMGELLVLPIAIGVFGFGRTWLLATRGEGGDDASRRARVDLVALLAAWALAGPVFAGFLNVQSGALGATLWERFRVLPEVVFAIAVSWGLDAWGALQRGRPLPVALAVLSVVASGAIHAWPKVHAAHTDALETYTANSEKSAPPHAVILGTGDYRLFSFLYADAIRLRADVTYIDPHLLGYDWYRSRASHDLGAPIAAPADQTGGEVALVDLAFSLGRPVLLTDVLDAQLVSVFPSYPFGTLIRLLPRGTSLPSPESVEQQNLDVFAAFRRWDRTPRDDEWASAVLPTYQRPWVALARMFDRRGDRDRATANRQRADEWGQQSEGAARNPLPSESR